MQIFGQNRIVYLNSLCIIYYMDVYETEIIFTEELMNV